MTVLQQQPTTARAAGAPPARLPDGVVARRRLLEGLPVTERRLTLAGIDTAVLEGGEGPPLVLLHGPGEYAAKWLRVIPELVRSHRVIAPDLPGHGASGAMDGQAVAEHTLQWLDGLIGQTCPEPPVLLGQVIGGAIAARYAARPGTRLSSLVLVDSLGLRRLRPRLRFALALIRFMAWPGPNTHDGLWRRCAFDLDRLREGMGDDWISLKAYNLDRARAPEAKAALRRLMAEFGVPAIPREELARIRVPTALIWGRHDLATPVAVARDAGTRHGWPVHVVEGCADDPPIERPEAFLSALHSVLGAGPGARP